MSAIDGRGIQSLPRRADPARPAQSVARPAAGGKLDLFRRMKAGEFADGQYVLRAKIDMAFPHLHLRDPVIYRIRRAPHHRTGDTWCIYLCTISPTACPMPSRASPTPSAPSNSKSTARFMTGLPGRPRHPCHPQQIEFARLNLPQVQPLMSKRKLQLLVQEGLVQGWDDPRMPTLGRTGAGAATPLPPSGNSAGASASPNSTV